MKLKDSFYLRLKLKHFLKIDFQNNISHSENKNKKNPKSSKPMWMKSWLKNRSDKSELVKIFSELLLADKSCIFLEWMLHHTLILITFTLIIYTLIHILHIYWLLKARIKCNTFLSEYFMKYSFRGISWNMKCFHELFLFQYLNFIAYISH